STPTPHLKLPVIWYKQYVHPPPGGSAKRCAKLLSGRRSPVLCVFPGCLRGCWCVPGNVQKHKAANCVMPIL
uniref:Thyroglobulin type-1 domain-containing protein n=1 Tax=Amphiprion ocellaris TaxID=80972 RepID=A0A3Q1ARK9_AMPOC